VQVAFEANELSILQGVFSEALVDASASASAVKVAKKLTIQRVFDWDRTVLAEIAGSEMITFVLDRCMQAIFDPKPKMNSLIVKIIPGYTSDSDFLKKTLAVTDFVCGMTDGYLRSTYLKLSGHEI
jgi:dGTP triphosphohydrolase